MDYWTDFQKMKETVAVAREEALRRILSLRRDLV